MERLATGDPQVFHEPAAQRYVLVVEGDVIGIAAYTPSGGAHVFDHTEVDPEREGRGFGAQLVKAALDDARARGWTIVPRCSFVDAYVRRHPEYADLLLGGNGRPASAPGPEPGTWPA